MTEHVHKLYRDKNIRNLERTSGHSNNGLYDVVASLNINLYIRTLTDVLLYEKNYKQV